MYRKNILAAIELEHQSIKIISCIQHPYFALN